MQLLPARPACHHKPRLFQQAEMLHDPDARHGNVGFELRQRATLTFEEKIEQEAARRVGQRLEHQVVVHTRTVYVTIWLHFKRGSKAPGARRSALGARRPPPAAARRPPDHRPPTTDHAIPPQVAAIGPGNRA